MCETINKVFLKNGFRVKENYNWVSGDNKFTVTQRGEDNFRLYPNSEDVSKRYVQTYYKYINKVDPEMKGLELKETLELYNRIMLEFNKNENKNLLSRLKEVRDNNPDLSELLESKFPEIVCNEPYAKTGDLFIRRRYPKNIYVIEAVKGTGRVYIKSVRDNRRWKQSMVADNFPEYTNRPLYLNKLHFMALLQEGGENINNIRWVKDEDMSELHNKLFN